MDLTTSAPPAADFTGPVRIVLGDGQVLDGYLDRWEPPKDHDGITLTYTFTPKS